MCRTCLVSLSRQRVTSIPGVVQVCFRCSDGLPCQGVTVLCGGVVTSGRDRPRVCRRCHQIVDHFTVRRVRRRRISSGLTIICRSVLRLKLIGRRLTGYLSGVLFTRGLMVVRPRVIHTVMCRGRVGSPRVIPVMGKYTCISLFYERCTVLFRSKGNRECVRDIPCQLSSLVSTKSCLRGYATLTPRRLPCVISRFKRGPSRRVFSTGRRGFFQEILFTRRLSARCRSCFSERVIHCCRGGRRGPLIRRCLRRTSCRRVPRTIHRCVVRSLTS